MAYYKMIDKHSIPFLLIVLIVSLQRKKKLHSVKSTL